MTVSIRGKSCITKISLCTGLLVFLLLLGISFLFCCQQRKILRSLEAQRRLLSGYVFLREEAPFFLHLLLPQERDAFEKRLHQEYRNSPEMLYFLLRDSRGNPLAFSDFSLASPQFLQDGASRTLLQSVHFPPLPQADIRLRCTLSHTSLPRNVQKALSEEKAFQGSRSLDLFWEIFSGKTFLGSYRQGFGLEETNRRMISYFIILGGSLLLLFGGIFLLPFLWLRNLKSSLSIITEDAEQVNLFPQGSEELVQHLEKNEDFFLPAEFEETNRLKEAFRKLKKTLLEALLRAEQQDLELENATILVKYCNQALENRIRERTALLEEKNRQLEEEILQRRKTEIRLRHLSITDSLTSLKNRRYADEIMETLEKERVPFSLVLLDIDDFKNVNDSHGHDGGDQRDGQRTQRDIPDLLVVPGQRIPFQRKPFPDGDAVAAVEGI